MVNTVEVAADGSGVTAWWENFTPEDADAMTSGPAPDPAVANKFFDYQALKYRVAEIGVYVNDLYVHVERSGFTYSLLDFLTVKASPYF